MKRASIRDLHLQTAAILHQVSEGAVYVIERRGVPVAELRPFDATNSGKRLPNRERFIKKLRPARTDSGRVLEEDRS
jgi:antitoxin (DNA-binding transcriptional repressor) of toxin-antitoxin stability system